MDASGNGRVSAAADEEEAEKEKTTDVVIESSVQSTRTDSLIYRPICPEAFAALPALAVRLVLPVVHRRPEA